ncbi:uncharacterized protein N7483_006236 [Penicillium malachiteum]|uniref:uncharacterized protein n=1 Tax=Penicillium malachiteum TaxID=1324776 RepID=UPI0025494480|nr:uncharacterized protein N7483_006236 [Penicillium malachiteum]KAJ5731728.1 hypothetical protein N7483_006236 [Penicillium malachiteum]
MASSRTSMHPDLKEMIGDTRAFEQLQPSLSPEGPVDQLTDAPEPGTYTLYQMKPILEDAVDFELWLECARNLLRAQNLHNFLDISLRPKTDHPRAQKWIILSRDVQRWLVSNMSVEIYGMIRDTGYDIQFADSFIFNARRIINTTTLAAVRQTLDGILWLKKADFPTSLEFLITIRDRFRKSNKGAGAGLIHPLIIFHLLVRELQGYMPVFIKSKVAEIEGGMENLVREFTVEDLNMIIDEMISLLTFVKPPSGNQLGVPRGVSTSSTPNESS